MPATGYTVSELMEKTGKSQTAIRSLLSLHNIKPVSYEAVYPHEALELLLNAKRGRPKKTTEDVNRPPETSDD